MARLTVMDDNVPPNAAFATVEINVNQGNQAPVANAGGPYTVDLGNRVTLNGAASSDPNASCGDEIVAYSSDIGNGAIALSGATPSLSGAQLAGLGVGTPHAVRLTVTDGFGATGSVTTTLTVNGS